MLGIPHINATYGKFVFFWLILLMLMLMLWPLAVTPGVTHIGRYHCPLDGHFSTCKSDVLIMTLPNSAMKCSNFVKPQSPCIQPCNTLVIFVTKYIMCGPSVWNMEHSTGQIFYSRSTLCDQIHRSLTNRQQQETCRWAQKLRLQQFLPQILQLTSWSH